ELCKKLLLSSIMKANPSKSSGSSFQSHSIANEIYQMLSAEDDDFAPFLKRELFNNECAHAIEVQIMNALQAKANKWDIYTQMIQSECFNEGLNQKSQPLILHTLQDLIN